MRGTAMDSMGSMSDMGDGNVERHGTGGMSGMGGACSRQDMPGVDGRHCLVQDATYAENRCALHCGLRSFFLRRYATLLRGIRYELAMTDAQEGVDSLYCFAGSYIDGVIDADGPAPRILGAALAAGVRAHLGVFELCVRSTAMTSSSTTSMGEARAACSQAAHAFRQLARPDKNNKKTCYVAQWWRICQHLGCRGWSCVAGIPTNPVLRSFFNTAEKCCRAARWASRTNVGQVLARQGS